MRNPHTDPILYGLAVIVFAVVFLLLGILSVEREYRLVGYGCTGSSGPLYAAEESDFPICKHIEVN